MCPLPIPMKRDGVWWGSWKFWNGRRNLTQNQTAQMSFSIAAVLILVLAGASVVIIGEAGRTENQLSNRNLSINEMLEEGLRASEEAEQDAYGLATRVCGTSSNLNESELNIRFQMAWAEHVKATYPKAKSQFQVGINGSSLRLDFLRLAFADDAKTASFQTTGSMQWEDAALPAYFFLSGNLTVLVRQGREYVQRTHELERPIYVPLPLLQNRLECFGDSFSGQKNDFENVVRYELSALIQSRVLNGYGVSEGNGPLGTAEILTTKDVADAMQVAFVLMQLKSLRTCDPVSLKVMEEWLASSGLDPFLLERKGELDPADLFLALKGEGTFQLNMILAQGLFASMDALVLKWLDYLHIIDLAKFMEQAATGVTITVQSVLDAVLGEDHVQQTIVGWIKQHLDDLGIPEDEYRWLNTARPDVSIFVPPITLELTSIYGDQLEFQVGGFKGVDFPRFDLFEAEEWKAFFLDYKRSTFELAGSLQNIVKSLALSISSDSMFPSIELALDPFDGISYQEELGEQVRCALLYSDGWYDRAMARSANAFEIKDALGQALLRFIRSDWMEIFDANASIATAMHGLAEGMILDATAGASGITSFVVEGETEFLASRIANDESWGVGAAVRMAFKDRVQPLMQTLLGAFDNITWDGNPELISAVTHLAEGLIANVPGVQIGMERLTTGVLDDAMSYELLRGDRILVQLNGKEGFHLMAENGKQVHEFIQVECPVPFGQAPGTEIEVRNPNTIDSKADGAPNRHVTDPENLTLLPFQSQFGVIIKGGIELIISSTAGFRDLAGMSIPLMVSSHIGFGFNLTLCALSGWPMAGVQYAPTATLLKDVEKVFQEIWDGIVGALQVVCDGFSKAFSFLQSLLSSVLSYCMKAIQSIADLLMRLVESLKGMIDGALNGFLGWFGDRLSAKFGDLAFNVTIGGMLFRFQFGVADIFLGQSKEFIRVTASFATLTTQFLIEVRFVDLYKKGYDVIATADLGGDDWNVRAQLDPRMFVMDHLLELRGLFHDFALELTMPEMVQYEKRSFRLSDVPGLGAMLSRIPVPIPGLLASIDAGLEVKFNRPISDHVVINEVEPNPQGIDTDREWIELYNPSNLPVDLGGWTIETVHGKQIIHTLGDVSIGPKARTVISFFGQALDNGGSTGIPLGESVVLRDAGGRNVDSTPFMTDYYNDGSTWQRSIDGAEKWTFKPGTPELPNGLMFVDRNGIEQLGVMMRDAALRASGRMNATSQGLDWLAELVKRTIEAVVEEVILILSKSLVELSIFIELSLQDATQSCSGAMRLALVVDGDLVRDALLWIADSVKYALESLTNPSAVIQRRHDIYQLLDDVHIRFGAYGKVGLPRLLSPLGDGGFMFGGQIDVNLATFIAPPSGPRNWTVTFGALFLEVPGRYLKTFFPVDADKLVDCWIMKATIRGLLPEEVMARRA